MFKDQKPTLKSEIYVVTKSTKGRKVCRNNTTLNLAQINLMLWSQIQHNRILNDMYNLWYTNIVEYAQSIGGIEFAR